MLNPDTNNLYWHFRKEPVSSTMIGQEQETLWETSRYWEDKLSGGWEEVMNDAPIDPILLQFKNQYPEMFDFMKNHSKYTAELLKEFIFEEVRLLYFPSRPSRRNCMFLFDRVSDVASMASSMKFDRTQRVLIEIRVTEGEIFRADLSLLNCNSQKYHGMVERARQYWNGVDENTPNCEILFRGKYIINSLPTTSPSD